MTGDTPGPVPTARSWDTYWQGAAEAAAWSAGGTRHPATMAFWDGFLRAAGADREMTRCIDICTGNGAVVERIELVFADAPCEIVCLDVSEGAIRNVLNRFPGVMGIAADAAAMPLHSAAFDVVTSQFGVEYAGPEAVAEAARMVAPGGRLGLMMHCRDSLIHKECAASLDAIRRTQQAQFIVGAIRLFEAGFRALRGGDPGAHRQAVNDFKPALRALQAILAEHGVHVAADTIGRLYNDVVVMHGRMQHYDPAEVMNWLRRMDRELKAYEGRMLSMCESVLNGESFEKLKVDLAGQGFSVLRAEQLPGRHGAPLAWVLIAERNEAVST